jgi:hypothetical protein
VLDESRVDGEVDAEFHGGHVAEMGFEALVGVIMLQVVVFEFVDLVAWDSHFLAADELDCVVGELEVEGVDVAFFVVT